LSGQSGVGLNAFINYYYYYYYYIRLTVYNNIVCCTRADNNKSGSVSSTAATALLPPVRRWLTGATRKFSRVTWMSSALLLQELAADPPRLLQKCVPSPGPLFQFLWVTTRLLHKYIPSIRIYIVITITWRSL